MSRGDWPAMSYTGAMLNDLDRKMKVPTFSREPEPPPLTDEELATNRTKARLNARQQWLIDYCDGRIDERSPSPYRNRTSQREAKARLRRLGVIR